MLNVFVIFGDREKVFVLLDPRLAELQIDSFLLSAYLDFYVTSPFGLFFYFDYLRNGKFFPLLGSISLISTGISAFTYLYLTAIYSVSIFSPVNIVFALLFAPAILLLVLVVKDKFNNKNYFLE